MNFKSPFKWRHFLPEIILLNVRWYLRYPLSYRTLVSRFKGSQTPNTLTRNLEEMMEERGLSVTHTTIYRWVMAYAPEINKRCRPHLCSSNDSWKVDETYLKVKGKNHYLYRAIDSKGNTLDFFLSPKRDGEAATRFLWKTLSQSHSHSPRVINTDQDKAYSKAVKDLKKSGLLPESVEHRAVK